MLLRGVRLLLLEKAFGLLIVEIVELACRCAAVYYGLFYEVLRLWCRTNCF